MIAKTDKLRCCGCAACVNACPVGCIAMQSDADGFQYPAIDEARCIHCKKCEAACPIVITQKVQSEETDVFAANDANTARRQRASSGGVFGLLAEHVLSLGGVVFGAAYDADFRVVHRRIDRTEELDLLRRTKYAQSDIGMTMAEAKALLQENKWVLFSGTPCQIAGLTAFLGKDYPTLLTVDTVCFAAPSPKAWQSYLTYRQAQDGSASLPLAINQREKTTGWSRYRYSSHFIYPNGAEYAALSGADPYMHAMVSGLITRPSCDACQFRGLRRCSDLTLGDYWGIWDVAPEMDDDKGTSLVLVHSDRGRAFLNEISKDLRLLRTGSEEAIRENPRILTAALPNPERNAFLRTPDWHAIRTRLERKSETSFAQKMRTKLKRVFGA